MNRKPLTTLAFAAILVALPSAGFAQDGSVQSKPAPSDPSQLASRMVPAAAVFTTDIDSRKMSSGSTFQSKLQDKVRLEGGPELPSGTLLVGRVVEDNTQAAGPAKLALQFTEADLKNGQTVPIKATIVNVYATTNGEYANAPLEWNRSTLGVDQVDVVSGVDLHSRIAGPNSGVFVSTGKDDIKLPKDMGIELAIAPRAVTAQAAAGGE